jgi:RNA polymerase-binding transcription factor DksA
MNKPSSISAVYLAPGASGGSYAQQLPGASGGSYALQLPGAMSRAEFPAIDDRLVEPETRTEMIDGEFRQALPGEPPHADTQCDVSYVIRANVVPGYVASTDLLTRVSEDSDFATDACIRRDGIDPSTGTRYLEELSFEVKSTQSVADLTSRARMLIRRGVRRVFAIFVNKDRDEQVQAGPVKEWSPREDRWIDLGDEDEISDPLLWRPVKVRALLDAAEANNQVARALLAQDNPVLIENRRQAVMQRERELRVELAEREAQLRAAHERERCALKEGIFDLCHALGVEVTPERRAVMESMDSEGLRWLRDAIRAQRRWPRKVQR